MRPTDDQLYAIAKLVGYCESIVASGLVGEIMERRLRERIAETLVAFGMDGHQGEVKTAMEQVR